jgi:WD40 repeat protein
MHPNFKEKPFFSYFLLFLFFFHGASRSGFAQTKDISKILWAANWSLDGKYIAVGGVNKKISLYDGNTFDLIKTYDHISEIQRFSWHPNKNLLAVAATDSGSKVIDVESDSEIILQGIPKNGSRSIAWNYNGEYLAYADYEGKITISNAKGELIRTIEKENTIGNVAIDWHPFKNEFIVLSEKARIYTLNGDTIRTFRHRKEDVLMLCVKWHPSGKFFVIGDYGDANQNFKPVLQFWDEEGKLKRTIYKSKAEYRNLSWNEKGDKLATASDALRILNKKGDLLAEGVSTDLLWGVDWSPNGNYIVTSSFEGNIIIWHALGKVVKKLN